jgi:hypothetical protein
MSFVRVLKREEEEDATTPPAGAITPGMPDGDGGEELLLLSERGGVAGGVPAIANRTADEYATIEEDEGEEDGEAVEEGSGRSKVPADADPSDAITDGIATIPSAANNATPRNLHKPSDLKVQNGSPDGE